jgi:transposase
MSLRPHDFSIIPDDTALVARAAFPKGNHYLTLRDELGVMYEDSLFAELFSTPLGRPAESPGCLALVTVLQFAENLSDRQAADAVRARIDWKYLLGLELTDSGFDYTLLHEFRQRVLENGTERQLLDALLKLFGARKLLKVRGRQRTDSTHVLAIVRDLNRLEFVSETIRHALNSLAVVIPDWLREQVPPEWFDRYGQPMSQWRQPTPREDRDALTETIGRDGFRLFEILLQSPDWPWLRTIPAVEIMRQVWLQQYWVEEGVPHWRDEKNSPPSRHRIVSPYDADARFATKRTTHWKGYKVHLTETCEADLPLLITNVETTPSVTEDHAVTETIHQRLNDKGLLPAEHLLDAGYLDARNLAESQSEYGVDLIGPVREDPSWQAKAGEGFDLTCFAIDWERQIVTCPQGKASSSWYPHHDQQGEPRILIQFPHAICRRCPSQAQCVRSPNHNRTLAFRPKEQHLALQAARRRQHTEEFKQAYAARSGVEGTVSQGTRAFGLRRSRYVGLAKTRLQHILTAAAIDLMRIADWLVEAPRAQARCSRFAALAPIACTRC